MHQRNESSENFGRKGGGASCVFVASTCGNTIESRGMPLCASRAMPRCARAVPVLRCSRSVCKCTVCLQQPQSARTPFFEARRGRTCEGRSRRRGPGSPLVAHAALLAARCFAPQLLRPYTVRGSSLESSHSTGRQGEFSGQEFLTFKNPEKVKPGQGAGHVRNGELFLYACTSRNSMKPISRVSRGGRERRIAFLRGVFLARHSEGLPVLVEPVEEIRCKIGQHERAACRDASEC